MRPVIVGQAPNRRGQGAAAALDGPSGWRIAAWLNLDFDGLAALADLVNLLPEFPGKAADGDKFPLALAKRRAALLAPALAGRRCILLGAGVARAFSAPLRPEMEWRPGALPGGYPCQLATVPHPSGQNLRYNDRATRAAAARFLAGALGISPLVAP